MREGAGEQHRVLRDDGDAAASHVFKAELRQIDAIDDDGASAELHQPKQSCSQRALASACVTDHRCYGDVIGTGVDRQRTCSADNCDSLASLNVHRQALPVMRHPRQRVEWGGSSLTHAR